MTASNSEISGEFAAQLTEVTALGALEVGQFIDIPAHGTPGNVGICLSGGGSRAMCAGMGQLRGLRTLTDDNGKRLLSLTKAVSTVSGGSWLGVTFEYLSPDVCSDEDYLGAYVEPGALTTSGLKTLSEKNIGFQCTHDFSILDLAVQAICLHVLHGVSADLLWQTLVGIHILRPYQLFASSDHPDSLFTYDASTLSEITTLNPSLKDESAHLVNSADHPRFLICNTSMFVKVPGSELGYLAPVQVTPFFSGIVSTPPNATDTQNQPVGGGGVTSFAFDSQLDFVDQSGVHVTQSRVFNDKPTAYYQFPHYSTFETDLDSTEVQVLASLTSWNVVEGAPDLFRAMYVDGNTV